MPVVVVAYMAVITDLAVVAVAVHFYSPIPAGILTPYQIP